MGVHDETQFAAEMSATGEFIDIVGSSSEENAVRFVFTRSNSATNRWGQNLLQQCAQAGR